MSVKGTRAARAQATAAALRHHAQRLFAQKGYAEATTDEVVRRARVTKGALYHHYTNKLDLYQAVVEEMVQVFLARVEGAAGTFQDPWERLRAACSSYLDACLDPTVARILMLEAPVVLGWKAWCDVAYDRVVALFARHVQEAVTAGLVRVQPPETAAQVILAALSTAARVVATAADAPTARAQVEETINSLLAGLRTPAGHRETP
jgi:AcrR family transcriptional regulator